MNFFKSSHPSTKRANHKSLNSEFYPSCTCEDLPNNIKATKIVLKLPFDPPKKTASSPYLLQTHLPRRPKPHSPILTLQGINNSIDYNIPDYKPNFSSTLGPLDILPHRYGVEFNYFQRVRSRIKNRPKLRRLIIKL